MGEIYIKIKTKGEIEKQSKVEHGMFGIIHWVLDMNPLFGKIKEVVEYDGCYQLFKDTNGIVHGVCNGFEKKLNFRWRFVEQAKQISDEKKFFNEVIGKKIRWSNWRKGSEYVIPTVFVAPDSFRSEDGLLYVIHKGFNDAGLHGHWEWFVEKEEEKPKRYVIVRKESKMFTDKEEAKAKIREMINKGMYDECLLLEVSGIERATKTEDVKWENV
jgi:hypothetical protein